MAKGDFDRCSTPGNCSVNYVWICPKEDARAQDEAVTRIPLHYFERMYENAARYPEADFNLWLDFEQLGTVDRFFVASHRYLFDASGIEIRDLRTIPEYLQNSGFDPDSGRTLYAKADYARILVLNRLLRGGHDKEIIYSDLDCEDVRIRAPEVREKLDGAGMAFGYTGADQRVCNGYIGLKGAKARVFMADFLLPQTTVAFERNLVNHFGAFSRAIKGFRDKYFPGVSRTIWGVVELPVMRSLMPYDAGKYEGVCSPRKASVPYSKELV